MKKKDGKNACANSFVLRCGFFLFVCSCFFSLPRVIVWSIFFYLPRILPAHIIIHYADDSLSSLCVFVCTEKSKLIFDEKSVKWL